jgi:hypothetical protein
VGGKVTELPVQRISADDSMWQRLKEWHDSGSVPNNAVWVGGQPLDRDAVEQYNAQMKDLVTAKGAASKGLAHVLGPLAGAAPEGALANAAVQGGYGALNAYAQDPEHKGTSALFGGTVGSMVGAGASMLGKGLQRIVVDRFKPPAVEIAPAPQATVPGAWSNEKILNTLGPKVAQKAMGGTPQPVAAAALNRIENADALEKLRAEIIKGVRPEDLGRLRKGMERGTNGVVDMSAMAKPYIGKDATQVASKGPFPPIEVTVDPTSTGLSWWLNDGRHRLETALGQGAHGIKANVSRYGDAGRELVYSGPLPLIRPMPPPVARSVSMVSPEARGALGGSALMSAVQARQAVRKGKSKN